MKTILETLGLPETATEADAVAAIQAIQSAKAEKDGNAKIERAIAAKIAQSGGALNREQAILALEGQAAHNANAKRK